MQAMMEIGIDRGRRRALLSAAALDRKSVV